jgi:hypothetical protein
MTYHRYKNLRLMQRKEDENTVIQGEHCVIVLKEMETFIWDRCNGEYSINDIIDNILELDDYCKNERSDIAEVVLSYMNDLLEHELIEIT